MHKINKLEENCAAIYIFNHFKSTVTLFTVQINLKSTSKKGKHRLKKIIQRKIGNIKQWRRKAELRANIFNLNR